MDIKIPFTIGIIASPDSGKTYLTKYILSLLTNTKSKDVYSKFHYGIILTNTKFNGTYTEFLNNDYVYDHFNEDAITNLMNLQVNIRTKHKKHPPPAFIVLDDCVNDFTNKTLINLFFNYRHYNISVIATSQYPQLISSKIRGSLKYCVSFRQSSQLCIKQIYEAYCTLHFKHLREFTDYMLQSTGDYKFIFIICKTEGDNFDDMFKIFKCPSSFALPTINDKCSVRLSQLEFDEKA